SVPSRAPSVRDIDVAQQRIRLGRRRRARQLDGTVDQRGDLALDAIEGCRLEQPGLTDAPPEVFEAIAPLTQPPDLVLASIELRVARMVAVEPASVDLDRARPAATPGALDRLARRLVNGKEIVAAHLDRARSEPGGAPP